MPLDLKEVDIRSAVDAAALGLQDRIAEKAILHLEAPILRVTGFDTPFPYTLEHEYLPDADRILDAVGRVLSF